MVAGKGPTGSVGAVHARCQSDYQQSCLWIAKGRDRPCMIVRVHIANTRKMACQARTGETIMIKFWHRGKSKKSETAC
jgi:hypothetical protein